MSPHAVNNFVSDLVLMAQAMERLPQVEHELASARQVLTEMDKQADSLRNDIAQAKDYAATLEAKVLALEVAKDAAETMFLQADDRTMRAVEFIKTQFGAAGSLIQALEPERAKPPVEETVRVETKAFDDGGPYNEPQVSEVKPIQAEQTVWGIDAGGPYNEPINPPQGQSEADPMPVHTPEPLSNSAPTPNASSLEGASSDSWATPATPDTKPQPYAGLSYQDYPRYVPFHEWIDGGGTSDTYYYPLHKAE